MLSHLVRLVILEYVVLSQGLFVILTLPFQSDNPNCHALLHLIEANNFGKFWTGIGISIIVNIGRWLVTA